MSAENKPNDSTPNLGEHLGTALSRALRTPDVEVGRKVTVPLQREMIDGVFGAFDTRLDYLDGCIIGTVFEQKSTRLIQFRVKKDGEHARLATIGRTPSAYRPKDGRSVFPAEAGDPGQPGEFLLLVNNADASISQARYLDQADLDGATVRDGQDGVIFGDNVARQRVIQIDGQVEALHGYR